MAGVDGIIFSVACGLIALLVADTAVPARLARYAREIGAASLLTGVDPLLIAAVLDRETLGGTAPQLDRSGPAGRGDNGHGHGLMQIDDRSHASFLAATSGWTGRPLWAMAEFNITYAAMGLRALIDTWRGDELRAVAAYNAGSDALRRA